MSNQRRLPQEIHDHIIDLFCDDPETLKQCSLVSKAWVLRTQNHLFSDIALTPTNYPKWQKVFPDPANSPACHTRVLTVRSILGDAEDIRWIQTFSCVERLIVEHHRWRPGTDADVPYLVPLYGLAHSLKSLRISDVLFPHPEFFELIGSLPLLEDLALKLWRIHERPAVELPTPVTPPALTGTLDIFAAFSLGVTPRFLLFLQGGLRFRKIKISGGWGVYDLTSVGELVAACSDTLEFLDVSCVIYGSGTGSIDLSKATKLKDIAFECGLSNSGWITMTLRTITSAHRNLQQISIRVPQIRDRRNNRRVVGVGEENSSLRWSDLDWILVDLWESHSVRPKVVCPRMEHGSATAADWARSFLPQLVERGIFDPVDVDKPREPGHDWH